MRIKTLFFALMLSSAAAQTYTTISVPGAIWTKPYAIGKNGGIIGRWDSGAFFMTGKGKFAKLAGKLWPNSINSIGEIAGEDLSTWGFTRSPQKVITTFKFGGTSGNYCTKVMGINDNGLMIGTAEGINMPLFLWEGTSPSSYVQVVPPASDAMPSAINLSGEVAGYYNDSNHITHGFLWSQGTAQTFDVPGAVWTEILTLDDKGYFAGSWYDGAFSHSYVQDQNGLATFDPPSAIASWVARRNLAGTVAGNFEDEKGLDHGYMRSVGGIFTAIDYPGASMTVVVGINPSGVVVGYYYDQNNNAQGFTYKP